GQIPHAAAVGVAASGTLDLNGFDDTLDALTLTGGHVATGSGTLTLGGNLNTAEAATTATVSGIVDLGSAARTFVVPDGSVAPDLTVSAVVSGGFGLTKAGAGTLVLSAANTYTGTTTVSDGVLDVNGSVGAVSLDGGTL